MIQFKKVIVHNFGSYGHAELELQNRGFCLVSGQNNYTKDNALSNGSGKSFLWSAICYALTGETINGIRSNLKNINIEDTECYVQLEFVYNKDLYCLHRVIAPKTDLKIYKNDIDVSGKGIRESEKKLQELLPDLTKDLVASTIIIGQGMPNKFSSFSPSGRKELLEKLTKSDFMISDIKTRIQNRQCELAEKAREFEDSLLVSRTKLNGYITGLNHLKDLQQSQQKPDFDTLIAEQWQIVAQQQHELDYITGELAKLEAAAEAINAKLLGVANEQADIKAKEFSAYKTSVANYNGECVRLKVMLANLQNEISRLKAIEDVCPTCGQSLPNVHKPDTSEQEAQLASLEAELAQAEEKLQSCEVQHQEYLKQITEAFADELSCLNAQLASTKQQINKLKADHTAVSNNLETAKAAYNKLTYDKQNWERHIEKQQSEIAELESEVARLTNIIAITSISKEDFDQRLAIIKKMDSLIRRDFRGYLLTNIISYIDNRAKDYCHTVFGTRELTLCLNGNALDITYCGKQFDGLSGGEKQRVDLILQLAIRDLLTSYLGLSANILVLDEVTDFLDKKSCQAVMKLLEKELKTVESVFIISHHSEELEIPVDSEIKVIKNEYGISELY